MSSIVQCKNVLLVKSINSEMGDFFDEWFADMNLIFASLVALQILYSSSCKTIKSNDADEVTSDRIAHILLPLLSSETQKEEIKVRVVPYKEYSEDGEVDRLKTIAVHITPKHKDKKELPVAVIVAAHKKKNRSRKPRKQSHDDRAISSYESVEERVEEEYSHNKMGKKTKSRFKKFQNELFNLVEALRRIRKKGNVSNDTVNVKDQKHKDNLEESVETSVSNKVTKQVTGGVTDETTTEVTTKVTDKVTNKVIDTVTNKVTDKVTNEVTDEVTNEVTDEVAHEVTDEVTDKVTNEVTDAVSNDVTDKVTDKVTNEATDEETHEGTDEETNEVTDEETNEVTNEATDEETHEGTDEETNEVTDEGTDEVTNELTDEETNAVDDVGTNEESDELTHEVTDEATDEVTNEGTDEVTSETTNEVTNEATDIDATDESTDKVTDKVIDEITNAVTNDVNDKVIDKLIDEITSEGTDEVTNELTDEAMDETNDKKIYHKEKNKHNISSFSLESVPIDSYYAKPSVNSDSESEKSLEITTVSSEESEDNSSKTKHKKIPKGTEEHKITQKHIPGWLNKENKSTQVVKESSEVSEEHSAKIKKKQNHIPVWLNSEEHTVSETEEDTKESSQEIPTENSEESEDYSSKTKHKKIPKSTGKHKKSHDNTSKHITEDDTVDNTEEVSKEITTEKSEESEVNSSKTKHKKPPKDSKEHRNNQKHIPVWWSKEDNIVEKSEEVNKISSEEGTKDNSLPVYGHYDKPPVYKDSEYERTEEITADNSEESEDHSSNTKHKHKHIPVWLNTEEHTVEKSKEDTKESSEEITSESSEESKDYSSKTKHKKIPIGTENHKKLHENTQKHIPVLWNKENDTVEKSKEVSKESSELPVHGHYDKPLVYRDSEYERTEEITAYNSAESEDHSLKTNNLHKHIPVWWNKEDNTVNKTKEVIEKSSEEVTKEGSEESEDYSSKTKHKKIPKGAEKHKNLHKIKQKHIPVWWNKEDDITDKTGEVPEESSEEVTEKSSEESEDYSSKTKHKKIPKGAIKHKKLHENTQKHVPVWWNKDNNAVEKSKEVSKESSELPVHGHYDKPPVYSDSEYERTEEITADNSEESEDHTLKTKNLHKHIPVWWNKEENTIEKSKEEIQESSKKVSKESSEESEDYSSKIKHKKISKGTGKHKKLHENTQKHIPVWWNKEDDTVEKSKEGTKELPIHGQYGKPQVYSDSEYERTEEITADNSEESEDHSLKTNNLHKHIPVWWNKEDNTVDKTKEVIEKSSEKVTKDNSLHTHDNQDKPPVYRDSEYERTVEITADNSEESENHSFKINNLHKHIPVWWNKEDDAVDKSEEVTKDSSKEINTESSAQSDQYSSKTKHKKSPNSTKEHKRFLKNKQKHIPVWWNKEDNTINNAKEVTKEHSEELSKGRSDEGTKDNSDEHKDHLSNTKHKKLHKKNKKHLPLWFTEDNIVNESGDVTEENEEHSFREKRKKFSENKKRIPQYDSGSNEESQKENAESDVVSKHSHHIEFKEIEKRIVDSLANYILTKTNHAKDTKSYNLSFLFNKR